MDQLDVLLRIENKLGQHEAIHERVLHGIGELKEEVAEVKKETAKTNGRVTKLEAGDTSKKKDFNLSFNKERVILVLGSVAYVISLVVERFRV